jgi:hypothetical protein
MAPEMPQTVMVSPDFTSLTASAAVIFFFCMEPPPLRFAPGGLDDNQTAQSYRSIKDESFQQLCSVKRAGVPEKGLLRSGSTAPGAETAIGCRIN